MLKQLVIFLRLGKQNKQSDRPHRLLCEYRQKTEKWAQRVVTNNGNQSSVKRQAMMEKPICNCWRQGTGLKHDFNSQELTISNGS